MLFNFILVFIGFFFLSPYSNYFFIEKLHFAHGYIEIFIVPLCFIYLRSVKVKSKEILFPFIGLFFLTLLGLLSEYENIGSLIPTIRSYVLFYIVFLTFKKVKIVSFNDLYWLSLGAIVGSAYLSYSNFSNRLLLENTGFSYIVDMTVIAIPIFVSLSILYHKGFRFLLDLLIVFASSFMTVTRGLMLFVILAVIISMIFISMNAKKRLLRATISLAIVGSVAYTLYSNLEDYIYYESPTIYNRLYGKVKYKSETGDNARVNHVIYIVDNYPSYILPRGFTTRKVNESWENTKREKYMVLDMSLGELLYTFGFFLFIPLLFIYVKKMILYIKLCSINTQYVFYATSSVMLIIFLFFGYGLISQAYSITFLAIFLALFFNPDQIKSYSQK